MPQIDLPLEQLLTYSGRSPRPADFDKFWDPSVAEMQALDPQLELVPHALKAPFAECFDLYFTGIGGARVHAKQAGLRRVGVCSRVSWTRGASERLPPQ